MNKQELLELLADAESELFHLATDNPENDGLRAAHNAAKEALETYAKAAGFISE